MTLIDALVEQFRHEGYTLEEAQVFPNSNVPFWHSAILDKEKNSVSAGFGQDRAYSRKVAIAEFLERRSFQEISLGNSEVRAGWGLNLIPTACGFAAGFDSNNSIIRSLSEATERWVMSKWIEDGYHIPENSLDEVKEELDEVSLFLISKFDRVLFFKKRVEVALGGLPLQFEIAQTMGLKNGGIFPGSSGQVIGGSIWQHACLESFRHLLFVKNNPVRPGRFPDDKIHFFSKNAALALDKIKGATNLKWPKPRVIFHRAEPMMNGQFFLARTIMSGWRSWHEGPIERFLY